MTRKRFDIIDVIVALIVGVAFGIFATFCFSSPSSEARFHCEGSGFIGLIEPSLVRPITCAGAARLSRLPLIFYGPKRQITQTLAELPPPSVSKVGKQQSRPTFIVTAYCGESCCCGEFADGITASGHKIQPGDRFVAAPPYIPFGTLMAIEGYAGGSMVSVEDRGGAIQGNRLDVFFGGKYGHEKALAWGVQHFEVRE